MTDPAQGPGEPEPHLATLLEQVFARLRGDLGGDQPYSGLRVSHLRVLGHVPAHGTSVTGLAMRARMTKQAMGQFATTLVEQGLLAERADADDRRVRLLHLTDRGHALNAEVADRVAELEAVWAAQVGAQRYATFRAVLADLATQPERDASPDPR